jgi:hypothetical protein
VSSSTRSPRSCATSAIRVQSRPMRVRFPLEGHRDDVAQLVLTAAIAAVLTFLAAVIHGWRPWS